MQLVTSLALLSLAHFAFASPLLPRTSSPPGNDHLKTVYQFPNETWAENLAVRANGNLLVTLIVPGPELWEVNPFTKTAGHLYTFPNATAALGIAEYAPDVFAVNVGNFSLETVTATEGSWSVWSVDMRGCDSEGVRRGHGRPGAKVEKLTDIPEAAFLNGMASLPQNPSTLVLADSQTGAVYSLDTKTRHHAIAIENVDALTPAPDAALIVGVNGLQLKADEPDVLYWTNSFKDGQLGRIAIDSLTGARAGLAEIVLRREQDSPADDFAFDMDGNAWITGSPQDTVIKVVGSEFEVVVNDTNVIAGPTACHFGRTPKDAKTLYVSTNGGLAEGLPQGIKGGAVVALDTAWL